MAAAAETPPQQQQKHRQWIPLEANPDVLTSFAHGLGLSSAHAFTDVWSLDLLDMLPSPCHAVLLLFPLTKPILSHLQKDPITTPSSSHLPFFCKQTISNACGTIALLHAALNSHLPLQPHSFLHDFLQNNLHSTPTQRAHALQIHPALDAVHARFAQQGQTAPPTDLDKVDMHFVCFVHHNGLLYELDGRRDQPIALATTTADTLLSDAARVIRSRYMAPHPTEHRFTILALTPSHQ